MAEKVGGVVAIALAVAVLYFISDLKPPIFVQIACAFLGSVVCLVGIVFLFAEGSIIEEHRARKGLRG